MAHIGHWVADFAHMAKGGASMFIHTQPPKHYLGYTVEGKAPVILIPGIFGKWGFYKHLGDKISPGGPPVYIVPKLGYNLKDIPTSASLVREVIDENNLKNCIIVAHSKGGLISKYLLIHLNKDNRVKGVISIATPYSGSSMARLLPLNRIMELDGDSKIIKDLASHSEVNKEIVSISPVFDNMVWAKEGSFLKGAENIKIDEKGHHKILFNKELEKLILQRLSN